jgi:universal stress protein A
MKIKPTPNKGKVVVELGSQDGGLLKPLPFQLRRILVPMDFSDTAKKALQYAVPLATAFDAEIVLVYVVQPYTVSAELGYLPPEVAVSDQEFANSARKELEQLSNQEIGTRARSQIKVGVGVPWQEIVAAACNTNADLIILSTHGHTGLKHALLGSVAERVVRHAPCPVLVVRERERDFVPIPAGKMGAARKGETT